MLDLPAGTRRGRHCSPAPPRAGLALNGLAPFWHDPAGRPAALTIGYAAPPDHAYAQTLEALATVLYSPQTRLGRSVSTR